MRRYRTVERYPLQHPQPRRVDSERAELQAGLSDVPLRETQDGLSEDSRRDVSGGFRRAGEDRALHEEFAGVPAAATKRPAVSAAELLGAALHSGSGSGPGSLRGARLSGAQHAEENPAQRPRDAEL